MLMPGYCWHAGLCWSLHTTVCSGPWLKRSEWDDLGNSLLQPSHVSWIVESATLLQCVVVVWYCDWSTDVWWSVSWRVSHRRIHDALNRSLSCPTDYIMPVWTLIYQATVANTSGFVMQYIAVCILLCTFAIHLLMRYAAAQALYVESLDLA